MTELSPKDASLLALIAENRKVPARAQKLIKHLSAKGRPIAESIVKPRSRGRISKTNRQTANAIRQWAASNKA